MSWNDFKNCLRSRGHNFQNKLYIKIEVIKWMQHTVIDRDSSREMQYYWIELFSSPIPNHFLVLWMAWWQLKKIGIVMDLAKTAKFSSLLILWLEKIEQFLHNGCWFFLIRKIIEKSKQLTQFVSAKNMCKSKNWSPDDVNRTGSVIEPIERNRTVEIRLSNAIESQSNNQILGNYSIGSIEIRLRSIEILRSIAFDLGSIMFDWDSIAFNWDSIVFDSHLTGTRVERTRHGCGGSSMETTRAFW